MVIFKTELELVTAIQNYYGLTLQGGKGKYNLLSPTGKVILILELSSIKDRWTFCGWENLMNARSDIGITLKLNATPQEKSEWLSTGTK